MNITRHGLLKEIPCAISFLYLYIGTQYDAQTFLNKKNFKGDCLKKYFIPFFINLSKFQIFYMNLKKIDAHLTFIV